MEGSEFTSNLPINKLPELQIVKKPVYSPKYPLKVLLAIRKKEILHEIKINKLTFKMDHTSQYRFRSSI